MLFPIIILICAALVLLSVYMPLRAAMQCSTQYAATAIATERSDTWLRFDPDTLSYYWLDDRDELGNVYSSLIGALVGNGRDDEDNAKQTVLNMENKNILKPSSDLTVEYGVVNYIVYKEIVVTARRTVAHPAEPHHVRHPKECGAGGHFHRRGAERRRVHPQHGSGCRCDGQPVQHP